MLDRFQGDTTLPPREASFRAEDLVQEIQAGRAPDQNFRRLFRLYFPSSVKFFINRGSSRHDAEDLAQEVLLSVYKSVLKFRLDASFDTWIFRILVNVWKNDLRRRSSLEGRAQKVSLDRPSAAPIDKALAPPPELKDMSGSPLQRVLADERTKLLLEAVDRLPLRMRQCVLLRVGQGLKYREIAEVMGLGVSSVKTHLGSAHERLRPLLEKHFGASVF